MLHVERFIFSLILIIVYISAEHDKILKEEQGKLKEMSEKHAQELKEIQGKLNEAKAQYLWAYHNLYSQT